VNTKRIILAMKKATRETQTLCAGCIKAEPKNFHPAADPFPGAQDGQNLISWRWSLPSPIDPVWWKDRCMQFRVIIVTDPQTNTPTNTQTYRQDWLQYTALQLASMQCKHMHWQWQLNPLELTQNLTLKNRMAR